MVCEECNQSIFIFKETEEQNVYVALCPFCRIEYIVTIESFQMKITNK